MICILCMPQQTVTKDGGLQCISNQVMSTGDLTGADVQECINQGLFDRGEDWLEHTMCMYATEGVGSAFCDSRLFDVAQTAINSVINEVIEKPVISVLTSVEDAAASFASSIASALCFWC
jgi:hypothetical protein